MYEYSAKITNIVDGDTIDAVVDLGFRVSCDMRFRLAGIDTPEIRGPERPDGIAATEFLTELLDRLTDGTREVVIRTSKDRKGHERTGKYGRYLATIWAGRVDVNQALIDAGHAERAEY